MEAVSLLRSRKVMRRTIMACDNNNNNNYETYDNYKSGDSDLLCRALATQLKHRTDQYVQAKARIECLEALVEEIWPGQNHMQTMVTLVQENRRLRAQVNEFLKFFRDHGLCWEGKESPTTGCCIPDIDDVLQKIKDMNVALDSRFSKDGTTTMLSTMPPVEIELTFYKDGVLVKEGNESRYRPYTDEATLRMIIDLQDEFLPVDFQKPYERRGLHFLPVKDRRHEAFSGTNNCSTEIGRVLGSQCERVGAKTERVPSADEARGTVEILIRDCLGRKLCVVRTDRCGTFGDVIDRIRSQYPHVSLDEDVSLMTRFPSRRHEVNEPLAYLCDRSVLFIMPKER